MKTRQAVHGAMPPHGMQEKAMRNGRRWWPALAAAALLVTGCSTTPQRNDAVAVQPAAAGPTPEVIEQFNAAMQLIEQKEFEKAIGLLNGVATASRNNVVALINLAMAYEKTGDLKRAEEHLKAALAQEPDNPVAGNEYAMLYRKTGRFQEARALYEQILKKYPGYALAHRNLGVLCDIYLKDYECALRGYQAYSSAKPEDSAARMWVADLQKRVEKQP